LVDALVSGTSGASRGGSSPLLGTIRPSDPVRRRLELIEKTEKYEPRGPVEVGSGYSHRARLSVSLRVPQRLAGLQISRTFIAGGSLGFQRVGLAAGALDRGGCLVARNQVACEIETALGEIHRAFGELA
jgi:hypothetical protein